VTAEAEPERTAAPLDVLLADAALGPVARWLPGRAGVRLAARLAARPHAVVRRGARAGAELARIAAGRSEVAPAKADRRFRDPAWTSNPVLRRLVQSYLVAGEAVEGLLDDADLEWRSDQRVRFLADNLVDALAPSNVRRLPRPVSSGTQTNALCPVIARPTTSVLISRVPS